MAGLDCRREGRQGKAYTRQDTRGRARQRPRGKADDEGEAVEARARRGCREWSKARLYTLQEGEAVDRGTWVLRARTTCGDAEQTPKRTQK